MIAPPASNPAIAPWVDVYRTAAIHPHDVVRRSDGISVTSRARTAFDLARWLPPDTLLSVIEQAAHDGRLSDRELHAVAVDWVSRQRPWVATFLQTLGRRLPGGSAESHPEVRVANTLRELGVTGLVRQHRIRLPSGRCARFDLAIPSMRIAIEVDVHPRHDETAGRLADESRDEGAFAQGWTTIRISRVDYHDRCTERLAEVADQIRTHRAMSEPAG